MKTKQDFVRSGVIVTKVALLLVPMLGFVALAVDYGYLLKVKTDLQGAADAAAVAAVRELVPNSSGAQNVNDVRMVAKSYAASNISSIPNFQVSNSDIQTGRFDPSTIYTNVTLLNNGTLNTVRVTVRRDTQFNSPVKLFFAPVLGFSRCDVSATATAVLRRARYLPPGARILPFAVSQQTWNSFDIGENFRTYGGGRVTDDDGDTIPGNWGTVDIGPTNNSTADISNQIRDGLTQRDLNSLESQGKIPNNEHIDSAAPLNVQGDPGLSSGLKHALETVHGDIRYVPIFSSVTKNGNNASYQVTGWGTVRVVNSKFQGSNNTYIELQKAITFDAKLKPNTNLSSTSGTIDGAYTSPGLVE